MEILHKNSNIRLIFFTLIFTSLIFILQNESLADRDAYLSWINNIEMITDSSHKGSKLIYFIAEPLWNYLLLSLKWIFTEPEAVITILNLTVGTLTAFSVLKNSKRDLIFSLLLVVNIFTLSSSINHIRSGLAMSLVLITFDYPNFNKSFISRMIRFMAFFIHMGTIFFIFIDYFQFIIDKFNNFFGRYASFLLGLITLISSNLFFLILTKYAPTVETTSGRGSFIGFAFYFLILILIIFSKVNERNKNYISIIVLSTYLSFYYTYPPIGRLLEMGYPFLIITILNIGSNYRNLIYFLFLAGNIFGLILNYNLLYVK